MKASIAKTIKFLEAGHKVVVASDDMEAIERERNDVASALNGRRLGFLDVYVAWIGSPPKDLKRLPDGLVSTREGQYESEIEYDLENAQS